MGEPLHPASDPSTQPPTPSGDMPSDASTCYPAEPVGPTSPLPPPATVLERLAAAGYEVLGELGKGGMGVVYKARQTRLRRLVALKLVGAGAAAHADSQRRFREEAEAIARLRHPNVVQIYDVGEADGVPFLSLEFVEGGSLDGHLSHGPWEPRQAAELVVRLARAMQAAHDVKIVHRDLKPSNVLLTEDGTPKVADFGLAKFLDGEDASRRTASGAIVGTASYMAPEQARGENRAVGTAADVWALGAILFELLTGRPPFVAANAMETLYQVVEREPVRPRALRPALSAELEAVCLKCLEKSPSNRYDSAGALAEDLARYLAGQSPHARPAGPATRLWRAVRRRPLLTALLVSNALVLLLVVRILTLGSPPPVPPVPLVASEAASTPLSGVISAGIRGQQEFESLLREAARQREPAGWSNDEKLATADAFVAWAPKHRQAAVGLLDVVEPALLVASAERPGNSGMSQWLGRFHWMRYIRSDRKAGSERDQAVARLAEAMVNRARELAAAKKFGAWMELKLLFEEEVAPGMAGRDDADSRYAVLVRMLPPERDKQTESHHADLLLARLRLLRDHADLRRLDGKEARPLFLGDERRLTGSLLLHNSDKASVLEETMKVCVAMSDDTSLSEQDRAYFWKAGANRFERLGTLLLEDSTYEHFTGGPELARICATYFRNKAKIASEADKEKLQRQAEQLEKMAEKREKHKTGPAAGAMP